MQSVTPWPHQIFDHFLSPDQWSHLQSHLQESTLDFRQDEDDEMKINYRFLPDLTLAKYFLSKEFNALLEKTTGHKLKINQKSLVQLRQMTEQSPAMPAHVDDQEVPSVVTILYVSKTWRKEFGGELCLLKSKDTDVNSADCHVVEPQPNRLIVFESKNSHWHCVQPVTSGTRYSIIMEWIIEQNQTSDLGL